MANLYYGNNGVMDLLPETLDKLKKLPASWKVILNVRPVSAKTARELDAIVITSHAIHVLEFKRRKNPIHIVTESRWLCNGQEMRNSVGGESPAEQVLNSTEEFEKILKHKLPKMARHVYPWVVLETYNSKNRIGTPVRVMKARDWQDDGWAKVANGPDHLEELLKCREASVDDTLSDSDFDGLRKFLGAKPLGNLSVQGHLLLLDAKQRMKNTRIQFTTTVSGKTFEAVTDNQGGFEVLGLPMEPFEVAVPEHSDLRVLPGATFKATTELYILHVFLISPHVSEQRVQELLQPELSRLSGDVEAVLALAEDSETRIHRLEQEMASTRQTVDTLLNSAASENNEVMLNTVDQLAQRIAALEKEKRQVEAVSFIPADVLRQEALEPLQNELEAIKSRVEQLEGKVTQVEQLASQAHQKSEVAVAQVAELTGQVDEVAIQADQAQTRATQAHTRATEAQKRAVSAEEHASSSASSARQAQGHAAISEVKARRAAEEAQRSRAVQAERLEHERTIHLTNEDRKKKRSEALKLSSIVGAAGGILSMQPLPFADNVILAPMQIWLVVRIGQIYGQSVTQDAALKLLGTLGFGFAAQHLTVAMYKFVPGLTFGLGPFTVFGFTVLLGAMTAMFYERGQMPDKAEQKAVMNGVKNLLKDRAFAAEIKEMGTSVAAEFKNRGYRTKSEDLQAVFQTASERARPIGERLERELFKREENAAE